MGLINTTIKLDNPTQPANKEVEVSALVDTGALYLCIPETIATQLGYNSATSCETKQVMTADGKEHSYPYVGPIKITFKKRTGFVGAVVMGNEILLGAIPLEDLDLVIVPSTLTLEYRSAKSQARA